MHIQVFKALHLQITFVCFRLQTDHTTTYKTIRERGRYLPIDRALSHSDRACRTTLFVLARQIVSRTFAQMSDPFSTLVKVSVFEDNSSGNGPDCFNRYFQRRDKSRPRVLVCPEIGVHAMAWALCAQVEKRCTHAAIRCLSRPSNSLKAQPYHLSAAGRTRCPNNLQEAEERCNSHAQSSFLQLCSALLTATHRHFEKMFGTLRYSPQRDDTEFIGISSSGPLDHGPGKPACDRCRLKKVWSSPNIPDVANDFYSPFQQRCSGQLDGCDRCKTTLSVCIYSSSGKGRAARRGKNSYRS